MADNDTPQTNKTPAQPPQEREPGTLIGIEVSYAPMVDVDQEEQNAIKEVVRKLTTRDMAARREQVIRIWEKHLFDRGFQHLLPLNSGGWQIPAIGSGYGPGEPQSRSMFETNIYNSKSKIIISALTREVPKTRFEPSDPDDDADITAAHSGDRLIKDIHRKNNMMARMAELARNLWLDGLTILFTRYEVDAQRFGYDDPHLEEEEAETVPETEEAISAAETTGEGEGIEGQEAPADDSESVSAQPATEQKGTPRGRQVTTSEGALEWKLPIKAECISECNYASRSREIPVEDAKAKYPKVADEIRAANNGPGGDDVDRLARINVRMGMMENYASSDSQAYDVTEQIMWIRPAALLLAPDNVRDGLIAKFPKGCRVIHCGQTFCEARNLSMDEQVTLCFAGPGDGVHRPGLGDWLMPIQKVLNKWMELSDDYLIRGVPNKWMDNEMFNVAAMRSQVNQVGAVHPFAREPGVLMSEVIFEETPLTYPEVMLELIDRFTGDLANQLCGSFEALSGGGDSAPTDTMGGMLIQRDQAIGVVGIPWRHIKEAIASSDRQAVVSFSKNNKNAVKLAGSEAVTIEMQQLQGNILAFPETDENFPETPTRKTNRIVQMVADATTNPMIAQWLDSADNLELIKNAIGIDEIDIPVLTSAEKQKGEITELLKSGPVPNPKLQQVQEQSAQITQAMLAQAQSGQGADPQALQQAQQLQQQMATLPPEVSTVEVDEQCDDHKTEAAICWKVINSPRGREMKNGTPDEQAGFQNLRLHYLEHKALIQAPGAAQKPVSVSANVKDLPPKLAAQEMSKAGIQATPQDFIEQDAAEAAEHHPGQVSIQ